jgi:hypothetical protein
MDSDKRTMRKRSGGKARKSDGGKARKPAPGTSGGQTPKRDRPADKPLTVMQFTQCMFGGLMQDRYTGVWADPAQKASYPNHELLSACASRIEVGARALRDLCPPCKATRTFVRTSTSRTTRTRAVARAGIELEIWSPRNWTLGRTPLLVLRRVPGVVQLPLPRARVEWGG